MFTHILMVRGDERMKALQVKQIRLLLKGTLVNGNEDWLIQNVIYYNRHILDQSNTMMFVSKKDSINWQELEKFAPCLLITDKPVKVLKKDSRNITILQVKSVIQSYWKFIRFYRGLFSIPVISITGTCGKTTTKEMIKHILSETYNVQASISSMNEPRRSLPYLMGINQTTNAAVFELGLGNSGNITHQCMIYQPTIGILTNIGVHHLDGTGGPEGYIQAKGEIVKGVQENGTLILNADDENTKKISLAEFKGKIIYFGIRNACDFQATNIQYGKNGMHFTLKTSGIEYPFFVPGYGEHQVYNALAALAAIREFDGIPIEEKAKRLASFKNMERHLEISKGYQGCTIIDDTWTNNPTSVEAALKVLETIGEGKKQVVILGDINRLGEYELEYHRKIGSMIALKNVDYLFTIGKKAKEIGNQAIRDQFNGSVYIMDDVNKMKERLEEILDQDSILLIKGPMSSRAMINLAKSLKSEK
jgi:UDP-N-acetylmuramoyl-tripeptide--D-alanyl-D-alanine ligase